MRTLNVISCAVVAVACLANAAPSSAIENVRGKEYHLTQKHGPWMIMVTSFSNVRDEAMKKDGLTAEQAAAELVFELRAEGIPAYTYSQDAKKGEINTQDRLGRSDRRIYAAQRDMVCVLAGNYESIEDKVGKKTLEFVKRFTPKFLKDAKNGAIVRADKGPLSGAFMTINPMVDPKDVVQRTIDKETKALNSGINNPLIKNPHKYTVQVASFVGKSAAVSAASESNYRGREGAFESKIAGQWGFNLARAGEDAGQLTDYLRHRYKGQSTAPVDEAYVYHDKFQSIVTIGGFDSPDDPQIKTIMAFYGPKLVPDLRAVSQSRRNQPDPLTEEELAELPKVWTTHTEQLLPKMPANARRSDAPQPLQVWSFDTAPKVIPVPRIK